jgi:hypothetical protein
MRRFPIEGALRRFRRAAVPLAAAVLGTAFRCGEALAAGGGKPATKLVNVADTRGLEPGFTRFVADVYNESYWLFALLVVVLMAALGLLLGIVADRLFALLGINLGRMSHHE